MSTERLTLEDIAAKLAEAGQKGLSEPHPEFPRMHELFPGKPRPAAVLIPLLKIDNDWHLLYTRRNANLPEHSGQVAFPGGRSDPGDASPMATALREAYEEIGLEPKDVSILGRLHDFITITNYQVTPIVGVIPWPYIFRLEDREVSRVFTIPLDWLAQPVNYEELHRALPAPYEPIPVIYYKEFDGEVLWGATARFTQALIASLQ